MSEAIIAIDFETEYSSDFSVDKLNTYLYTSNPRLIVYLVALVGPDWQYVGPVSLFNWSKISGKTVCSHNATFDQSIYLQLRRRGPISAPPPSAWYCTADLSAYLGCESRSLESAAKILLDKTLDKGLRAFMKGRRYSEQTNDIQLQLQAYALSDAQTCRDLWVGYHNRWPESERQLSLLNREIGFRGIGIDVEKSKQYNQLVTTKIFEIKRSLRDMGFSDNEAIMSPKKFYACCERFKIPKPISLDKKVNPHLDQWIEKHSKDHPWIADYFLLKQFSSLFQKRLEYISKSRRDDGTVPYSMLYFGAHTGRFTGTGGWNLQTLPKESVGGIDLRSLFISRDKSKKLGILDYSQIEARILLLMSGQKTLLDMVRKGSNIYESYARLHLGWTGGKLKAEDPKLYALSKAMVLGLGYGCGAVKFKELLSDVYGIETTLVKATGLVNEFRQSNPGITRLWHDYNRKLANSVKSNLLVDLPGGRQLKFLNINRDNQGDIKCQFGFGGLFKKIYGSKVCENVVQSVARDVFCDGMLRVAQAGYAILLHVHDELVVEVEDQKDLDKVAAIMKIPPVWMKDLPIDVGAELVDHYKK